MIFFTLKSPEVASALPTELISAFMFPKIASRSKSAIAAGGWWEGREEGRKEGREGRRSEWNKREMRKPRQTQLNSTPPAQIFNCCWRIIVSMSHWRKRGPALHNRSCHCFWYIPTSMSMRRPEWKKIQLLRHQLSLLERFLANPARARY